MYAYLFLLRRKRGRQGRLDHLCSAGIQGRFVAVQAWVSNTTRNDCCFHCRSQER